MSQFDLLFTTALAVGAASGTPLAVPSGTEVWLQEVLTEQVAGMGLVSRFRFVMPALAAQVPEIGAEGIQDYTDEPLSAEDEAALNDGSLSGTPAGGAAVDGGAEMDDGPGFEVLPPDTPATDLTEGNQTGGNQTGGDQAGGDQSGVDQAGGDAPDAAPASPVDAIEAQAGEMIPEEAFDLPVPPVQAGAEAAADADIPLPAAPDVLMQDPNHIDVVWLCENVALPQVRDMADRPSQVVISLASAESEFGTFDPAVVQLFEGFRIPPDRDACIWEPW